MRNTLLNIIVVCLVLSTTSLMSNDQCSDILNDGIRDTYDFSDSSTMQENTYDLICKKSNMSNSGSSGFSIDLPLPDLGMFGLGSRNSHNLKKIKEFCKNSSSSISKKDALTFTKSISNKDVVKAWEKCMSSKGLYCKTENTSDTSFKLKITWDPNTKAYEPEIRDDLFISHGHCVNTTLIKIGSKIEQFAPIVINCKRDGNKDSVFVSFNTSQGAVECRVPKLKIPIKPKDYLTSCIEGNYKGCVGMMDETQKKYKACKENVDLLRQNNADGQVIFYEDRKCGNQVANTKGTIAIIENMWRDCNIDFDIDACINSRNILKSVVNTPIKGRF